MKTWLNNIWEGFLKIILGVPIGYLGMLLLEDKSRTSDDIIIIVNWIPFPSNILTDFLTILLWVGGFSLALIGVMVIVITLFRRVFKKRTSYDSKLLKDIF